MSLIHHKEEKIVNFTVEQVYSLVIDVKEYPEFVPFCISTNLYDFKENNFYADMKVGTSFMNDVFTTEVKHNISKDKEKAHIEVDYKKGAFKKLNSIWKIEKLEEGKTKINFNISFELKSGFLQKALEKIFDELSKKMVSAFLVRANQKYL